MDKRQTETDDPAGSIVRRITPMIPPLLLAGVILTLGACGGTSSSEEETSTDQTGSGETSSKTGGGRIPPAEITGATVLFTPSQDSGISGVATLTETENGVEVKLNMRNLPDQTGTEHLAHLHEGGTCADDRAGNGAPIRYPLGSVATTQDGTGASTTVIPNLTIAQLFSEAPKYINVHAEQTGDEVPPGISCADLSTTTGGD
ncbi:MAG: CHRD domain-containing protein [Rubrobacter sp.]|nr:CHRD domain-containing protein [Rubrobacter sp.]